MPYGSQGLIDLTSYRNMIANGAFTITQDTSIGTVFTGLAAAAGTRTRLDRWRVRGTLNGADSFRVQNVTLGPGLYPPVQSGSGLVGEVNANFINDPANDVEFMNQWQGANNTVARGNLMLLDFWINSTTAGSRCVAIQAASSSQSYVMPFTILAANVWQRITLAWQQYFLGFVNISGVVFPLIIGATAAPGRTVAAFYAWTAGDRCLGPGAAPLLSTTGDRVRIAEMQVLASPVLAPFEVLTEYANLQQCRQFLQMSYTYGVAPGTVTLAGAERPIANVAGAFNNSLPTVRFPIALNAQPSTVTLYNPEVANNQVRRVGVADYTASTAVNTMPTSFQVSATGDAGAIIGSPLAYHWLADVGF